MGYEGLAAASLFLSGVLIIAAAILVSACATSPLIPYAVEVVPPAQQALPAISQVQADPVQSTETYREFKSTASDQTYFVPVRLTVAADSNRARAIMLVSHDGKRAIFQAIVGPPPLPDSDPAKRQPVLYPIDRLLIRTLTSSQDPSLWRVTATSEPVRSQPFTFLVNIQVFGRNNIKDFKAILRGEEGFLLEARFAINTTSNSRFEIGAPVSLNHLSITEQTM